MPANRNALIRYKTIDLCLQNKYRKWTLEDLINACSDVLYEYEGIKKGVSRRTVQLDIQLMRSDKLGYNAPIIVLEKKYYTYEDSGYSIMNIPLSESDLNKLMETVDFLKQFKGFSHFRELDSLVQKLEDHVYSKKINRKPVIDFEKNENLKGIEFLEILYQSIIRKNVIDITYQSFNARQAGTFSFYPYLLKEFRNRWFLFGLKNNSLPLLNLAIDRIINIKCTEKVFIEKEEFNAEAFFKDVIGVTVDPGIKPEKIILFVNRKHAPYVLTKPIHPSQKLIDRDEYGITISLEVQHNYELEKEILGLGDGMVVISPEKLKTNIFDKLNNAVDQYNTTMTEKGIIFLKRKYLLSGFGLINKLFSHRSIAQINLALSKGKWLAKENEDGMVIDLETDSTFKALLLNSNMEKILSQITDNHLIISAKYYDCIPESLFEFKQSNTLNQLVVVVLLSDLKSKIFSLQVIPGSQNKLLNDEKIHCIVDNCVPVDCQVNIGGAILINPILIKRFPESLKNEKIKYITMEFTLTSQKTAKSVIVPL